MKRMIRVLLVLILCFSFKTVYAENYKLKELIPYNVDTTIHTDNFSYKGIRFDEKGVHFNGIKNLTKDKLPISISIGLFDKKGINIGTINYCDSSLEGEQELSFLIKFGEGQLGKNKKIKDIKYIAILGDNINCRTQVIKDYLGQSVDKLGIIHNNKLDNQTEILLSILTVIAGALLVFVVYKLIFTRAYRNIDGNEVIESYEEINRELKELREQEEKNEIEVLEPEPEEEIEVLEEEKEEDTDLHNLYK